MVRFDEETLAALQRVIGEGEDRSDFVRAAVELETAIRSLDVYADLKAHLLANESIEEFCAKAVRRGCSTAQGGSGSRRRAKREKTKRGIMGPPRPWTYPLPLRRSALALVIRPAARCTARHRRRARVILIIDRDRAKVAQTTQHVEYAVKQPESPGFPAGSIPTGVRYRKRETTGVSGDGCVPSALSAPSWAPPDQHKTFII